MMSELIETASRWDPLSRAVNEICAHTPVSAGVAGFSRELARTVPELNFREVLVRGGWYRLGGVVDAEGTHVSDDLEQWAETQLAARDDDMQRLGEDYAAAGLRATRLTGKTHYWVASTGADATEFLQVEIEELQEVICHPLFGDELPSGLADLVDPESVCENHPVPLGIPFYALRKVTDVNDFIARMRSQKPEPQAIHRFFEAWEGSSAGKVTHFYNQWVLAVREHMDRYRQAILSATPVAALHGAPPRFETTFGARGLQLMDALTRFDRQAGYPMAWFFHLLTTKSVPHAVANAVIEDVQTGFSYLPERDVQVVRDWVHRPYSF